MSEETNTQPRSLRYELHKPTRAHLRRERADNLKAPQSIPSAEDGEKLDTFIVYVTKTGIEKRVPCTTELWRRVEGHAVAGRPHPGLDQRLHNNFLVYFDKVKDAEGKPTAEELAVDIDILPKNHEYQHGFNIAGEEKIKDLSLTINQITGSIEVDSCPRGFSDNALDALIAELNKVEDIYPGQQFGGKLEVVYKNQDAAGRYEVTGVAGNHVVIAIRQ